MTPTARAHGAQAPAQSARFRLPENLANVVGDLTKLRKPEGLTAACYTFPNYHVSALQSRLYGPGWTEYVLTSVEFPDYGVAAADVVAKQWTFHARDGTIPYLPAIGVGWDPTPRFAPPRGPRPAAPNRDVWPACAILTNESPAAFKAFVQAAFAYLNEHPQTPRILTISCWNEWSEGHYLLPDNRFGYGMLDALAEALGKSGARGGEGK